MRVSVVLFLLFFTSIVYAEFEYRVENSNFTISQHYSYNYNRLRFRGDYTNENLFFTFIGDGVNYYGEEYIDSPYFKYTQLIKSDTPFKTQTKYKNYDNITQYAKIYRAYMGYEDGENRVILGLQNISMGVGRIWNPSNIFNPKNSYALEPNEIFAMAAISYTRQLDDTSQLTALISQKADKNFKYALEYKTNLDFSDFAFSTISSKHTKILAYGVEANLGETGIEIRSEGAYIKSVIKEDFFTTKEIEFFQGIVGAEYAFVNGVDIIVESLYSSKEFSYQKTILNYDSEILQNLVYSHLYTAISLNYNFNIYLNGSFLYIESFNEKNSRYISPKLIYTLNDYNSFTLGAILKNGAKGRDFGELGDSYYIKYSLSF